METAQLGILAGITISVSFFAMIFGVFYLYKREKMAMIERGMDPRSYKPQSAPYQNLKWGLLLVGSGIGLFLAFILDHLAFANMNLDDSVFFLYLSQIAIFGGLGLFLSYKIEKKEVLDKEDHTLQK